MHSLSQNKYLCILLFTGVSQICAILKRKEENNQQVLKKIRQYGKLVSLPMARNTIKVQILDKTYTALVDSGSAISAISQEVLRDVQAKQHITVEESKHRKVKLADGTVTEIQSKVRLPLVINNTDFITDYQIIENLTFPVILGLDFLTDFAHSINFENQQLISSSK